MRVLFWETFQWPFGSAGSGTVREWCTASAVTHSWPSQVHCKDNCRPSRTCDFVPSTLRMHPTDPMPLMLMQLNCRNHNWHNLRIWQFQDTQFRGPVLWCEMAGCGNRASTCGSQGETIVIGHEYTYTDTVLCAVHFLVSITALTCWQMFNCQRL